MRFLIASILVLLATTALAQQAPPQQPPEIRAVISSLSALQNDVSALRAALEMLMNEQDRQQQALADYWRRYIGQ
jgi:peptidoglycan hydrolase CwlO-like protein